MRILTAVFLTALCVLILNCSSASVPNRTAFRTPEGDEVEVSCPVSVADVLGPTKVAELVERIAGKGQLPQPGTGGMPPREELMPANSLGALLPPDSTSGVAPNYCGPLPNSEAGSPFSGFFAPAKELDRLGRLCGCLAGLSSGLDVRIDLYEATTGAREAFRQEAKTLQRGYTEIATGDLDALGDERILRKSTVTVEKEAVTVARYSDNTILMRRSNIVARITVPHDIGTPDMAIAYAIDLDRNIRRAADRSRTPLP